MSGNAVCNQAAAGKAGKQILFPNLTLLPAKKNKKRDGWLQQGFEMHAEKEAVSLNSKQ
jgi:hypothetical protein